MTGSDPAAPEQSHQATSERDRDDAQPWWSGLDWLLWGCALAIVSLYGAHWLLADAIAGLPWLPEIARSAFEFMNTIWWGIAAGIVMISLLGRVPREFVMQVLGTRRGLRGLWRATLAGLLLDLCSHAVVDPERIPADVWTRVKEHYDDGQIVEIVATVGAYLQVSKFGDALGVQLEDVFTGHEPVLFAKAPPTSPASRTHLRHFIER